jgi:tetratricopeptide (TPR) repeat protein
MKPLIFSLLLLITSNLTAFSQTNEEYYNRAIDFYDNEEYSTALEYINRCLVNEPKNGKYLLFKGNTLEKQDKLQEAFEAYSQAIKADPKYSYAYNQRGVLLMKIQEPEYSIRDFSTALEFEKNDTIRLSLLLNRGSAKIRIRDFKGAYNDFIATLKLDSLNIGVLNNLAAVCDEVGKGDQTLGYLYKIIQIDSTFIGAYGNIGFKYQEMGDYKTAIKFFNKVLELEPDEPLAYSNRAYNRYKLGDLQTALTDINLSIKLYPANSYAFRTRALIYLALKKNIEACSDIEESLKLGFTKMYGEEVEKLKKQHCDSDKAMIKKDNNVSLVSNSFISN